MLTHNQIVKAIQFIRPNAEFSINDLEIQWLDTNQIEPTLLEIEAGWIAYQAAQESEAEAKAAQKAALLNKLGITEDEARLLLGGN
jgi:hypothetical protein